ncbi:helix-turn-helix transcriptional regulator [Chitinophaga pendula]|nr:AraC family transcriptional regulator [Chitinophaga sp. MD30]UCJ10201.1 helix-turn-helix transcriptional regulator [Chitinophaga pendula]
MINPATGILAFRVMDVEDGYYFRELQQQHCYTMLLVTAGSGQLNVDFSEYMFEANTLLCFSVYQPFLIRERECIKGVLIQFHPDFFCIHKHQEEVSCNGILFNDVYGSPMVNIDTAGLQALLGLVAQFKTEMQRPALGQYELLVSYLKVFLIMASRMKLAVCPDIVSDGGPAPFLLKHLKEAIEEHYRTRHSPADYGALLNISPKALNKLAKSHFNRTLRDLIAERIIIEAKRELYLTSKPVKAIAYELGFTDEFYFSRFFKSNASVSPQLYRTTVGMAKGEV